MALEITVGQFPPRLLAVYPTHATRATLGKVLTSGPVWPFVRSHGIANTGINIVVYGRPQAASLPPGAFPVELGVEVLAPFTPGEGVANAATPDALAVTTRHIGPYDRIAEAYDALSRWASASGRRFGPVSWEIYGHWNDDTTKLETDIFLTLLE